MSPRSQIYIYIHIYIYNSNRGARPYRAVEVRRRLQRPRRPALHEAACVCVRVCVCVCVCVGVCVSARARARVGVVVREELQKGLEFARGLLAAAMGEAAMEAVTEAATEAAVRKQSKGSEQTPAGALARACRLAAVGELVACRFARGSQPGLGPLLAPAPFHPQSETRTAARARRAGEIVVCV